MYVCNVGTGQLSVFNRRMIVFAKQGGLSMSETIDFLDFKG